MLRNGKYPARAIGAALGFTRNNSPQIAVELQITEGESAGQTITWFGYFTEKTEERTLESLRTLGWQGDDLDKLDTVTGDCSIVVEQETWEGKTSAKVQWINKVGGGLALSAPMDAGAARAFAERMKGKVIASRQASGTQTPSSKPTSKTPSTSRHPNAPEGVSDSDIPF